MNKIKLTPEFVAQIKFAQGADLSLEDLHLTVDDGKPVLRYSISSDPVPPDPTHPKPPKGSGGH